MTAQDPAGTTFSILGSVEVRHLDGTTVAISGPKRQAILALLLLEPGRTVSTDRLIEALYADGPLADAANALHGQVSRLRRLVAGTGAAIESGPAGYRLAVEPDAVDAHLFARLAADGRRIVAADPVTAERLLAQALALWQGRDRPDLPDVPFLHAYAARLGQLRTAAVEDHAEAALACGEPVAAVAGLSDLLAAQPLRERACALLMRALYDCGQQAEALELYERTRRALAAELGADPSPELAAAHLAILRDRPAPGPRRTPAQLTSFVGRDDDLARLAGLLAGERLVTLTGPGGTGKTRLAIEAAAAIDGELAFIELAPLTDARLLAQTIAAALGLTEPRPQPAAEGHLLTALADRRLLLILDNCEHVVDATARLAHRLLAACPEVRILATSRESLGLTGEALFPVGQLAVAAAGCALEDRLASPAVRLFADRARTVRPDFRLDEDVIDDVVRICAGLDGLPLAIELAAARLRSLTPAEVAAGLSDRFRLLSRGSRTAEPRHQTLRAVTGWSWELLDPAERTLARRLTVFAGGATVASATAVCGLPEADVPDLLAGLTEKSFVDYSGGRYRMLETIRAFCAEQLAEAGEELAVRTAHAEYFGQFTAAADPQLRGRRQLDWLDRLAAENDNLRAALRWTASRDARSALRMAAAMSWYWYLGGRRHEGAVLCVELLAQVGDPPPADLAEEYLLCAGNAMAAPDPGPTAARRLTRAMVPVAHQAPRWPSTAVLCRDPDRPAAADAWSQAVAQLHRGTREVAHGGTDAAEAALTLALEGFHATGDRWGTTNALDLLAELAAWRGDWPGTLALMSQAVDTAAELVTASATLTDLLCRRAKVRVLTGDLAAARADLDRAAATAARAGRRDVPELHQGLGDVARQQGDLAEAADQYAKALAGATVGADARFLRLKTLRGLGWIAAATDRPVEAARLHRTLLDEAAGHRNYLLAADAVIGLAGVALLHGDGARAALLLGAARAVHGARLATDTDTALVMRAAEELIGPARYAAALAEGEAWSRDEALAAVRDSPLLPG
ncbi:BTAD domain-containing putative transcriptional regulator [Hamadaea tsunoensis]|uniref:BTAD domain-containing putative transcriptional regulator n=1 Tax=Hamadaea tsunoensis TaxID=53368 RepID=UPI0006844C24|nr:BTAD domain-containing putative transcriptional regulator [Hamadaea tsunoensis]